MGRNKGICTICGRGTKLSFEHVPPAAAGNVPGVQMFGLQDWLDRDEETNRMTGGKLQPEGTGAIALCRRCNGFLGQHYVPAFAHFVETGRALFRQVPHAHQFDHHPDTKGFSVVLKNVDRLLVSKQILAMLAVTTGRNVMANNQPLLDFIMDPAAQGLPLRHRLFLGLTPGPMVRVSGLSIRLNVETGERTEFSEIVYPPFAYLLTFNGADGYVRGEITDWTGADPGPADAAIDLLLGFAHTAFPGDLRSRAALDRDVAANNAKLEAMLRQQAEARSSEGGPREKGEDER